ncbi:hypothetical protein PTKIN_Ptkin06aG0123000 [Pterospermum kingtungense]
MLSRCCWVQEKFGMDSRRQEKRCIMYHFETEIEEMPKEKFDSQLNVERNDYDLNIIALIFKQNGFKMTPGVFDKFKNKDGKFQESLSSDIRSMLSLYEASHLRVHGERILDEAFLSLRLPWNHWTYVAMTTNKLKIEEGMLRIEKAVNKLVEVVLSTIESSNNNNGVRKLPTTTKWE